MSSVSTSSEFWMPEVVLGILELAVDIRSEGDLISSNFSVYNTFTFP